MLFTCSSPLEVPWNWTRRCEPFSSNVTPNALTHSSISRASACQRILSWQIHSFISGDWGSGGGRRTLYSSLACRVSMTFEPQHQQTSTSNIYPSIPDNGYQQARRQKLVMTLNNLSDGESTVILSAKKGDEESGGSSATTDGSATLSKKEQTSERSDEFPTDGGIEGWTCVVGGWFALFATFGWLNSYVSFPCSPISGFQRKCLTSDSMGLFQTYYERALLSSYSASAISWIFTTQLFLM